MKFRRKLVGLVAILALSMGLFVATPTLAYGATIDPTIDTWEDIFPDIAFRSTVQAKYNVADGTIGLIDPTVANDISIETFLYAENAGISSLSGIEYFERLDFLSCSQNNLTSLDVSANTVLTQLFCSDNQLISLILPTNTLKYLNCSQNNLASLDVSASTTLTDLYCSDNQLASLILPATTTLSILDCSRNNLTSLNVSTHTALTDLYCSGNQLASLDVSNNTDLINLYCSNNQLTSLDVSTNAVLKQLLCNNNFLTSLNVSANTDLEQLYCNNNLLTSLNIPASTNLVYLYCNNNQLTSLDVTGNPKLTSLFCNNNQLTSLDVSANTALVFLRCVGNSLLTITGLDHQLNLFDAYDQTLTIPMVRDGSGGYISVNTYPVSTGQTLTGNVSDAFTYDPVSMKFRAPKFPVPGEFTTSFASQLGLPPISGTLNFVTDHLVTFESNGGSAVDPQTLLTGELLREPLPPTRAGYTFDGWYSDSALTQKWDFATPVNADMTLYAKWSGQRAGRGGAGSDGLANTGDNVLPLGLAALGILAGAGMLLIRRKIAYK